MGHFWGAVHLYNRKGPRWPYVLFAHLWKGLTIPHIKADYVREQMYCQPQSNGECSRGFQ